MSKISQYPSVDDLSSTAKSIFMSNASIPSIGQTEDGGPSENYNIPVSEIVSSLPAISAGDGGKVLTVNSNEDGATWDDVPGELPAIGASDAGKVLTVNAQGTGVEWATAGGGGGGTPPVEVIDFKTYWDNSENEDVLFYASKTPSQVFQIIKSNERQVVARICRVDPSDHSDIIEIYIVPFSYMYYSDGVNPLMFFNWNNGTAGGSPSITGDVNDNSWSSASWDSVNME